jgi:hypothetical protein
MNSAWLSLLYRLLATGMQARAVAEYGGDNSYYYAGLLSPFPGSDLGNGFVQRY